MDGGDGFSCMCDGEWEGPLCATSTRGRLEWVSHVDASNTAAFLGAAVLPSGEVVAAGEFKGLLTFGGNATFSFGSTGTFDTFMVSVGADGSAGWLSKGGGSSGDDAFEAVGVASSGEVFVTGGGGSTNIFASSINDGPSIRSGPFVARYNPADGVVVRVHGIDCFFPAAGRAVLGLADGGSIVAGEYFDYMIFERYTADEATMDATSLYDVFLARFDAQEELVWARSMVDWAGMDTEPVGSDRLWGAVRGAGGKTLLTGTFDDTLFLDVVPRVASPDGSDGFVMAIDDDGTLDWGATFGGPGVDLALDIAAFTTGFAVVGTVEDVATFGQGETNETMLGTADETTGFVARFDDDGELLWAQPIEADNTVAIAKIVARADNGFYVAGHHRGTLTFAPGTAEATTVSSGPAFNSGFLASYAADGMLEWVRAIPAYGDSDVRVGDVLVRPGGGPVVVGETTGGATFGPGEPGEVVLIPSTLDTVREPFVAAFAP